MGELNKGDRVRWNTPQGETRGKVVDVRTKDFQLSKQHFTASPEEPMFIVESESSGKQAAHKGESLSRA